jgi:predicted ATP-dependent protease
MAAQRLAAQDLAVHCDAASLDVGDVTAATATGAAAAESPAPAVVGQERARAAVEFGIAMPHPGYHLFVMGPPGTGKRSLARHAIDAHVARHGIQRSDWVYVHNFERPHQPVALMLPAGRGTKLRCDMRALVEELRTTIPAAFESEEYAAELERLNTAFKERAEQGLMEVGAEAQHRGLMMIRTPVGFTFAPRKGDEVMSTQAFESLPQEERQRLQQAVSELQERLVHVLRASMRLRKEHADHLRTLNRATTQLAVDHAVDETKARYADLPAVARHLEAVRSAVIENADAFRSQEDGEGGNPADELARYEINLVVDAGGSDGSAIVETDLPSHQNLVGRIDHVAHFGMLLTDFRHIQGGLLHRANGGYLLIDAMKLLTQPFAWSALKRALLGREIRIESMAEVLSMVSTIQLEPQPIPLDVKVVLVGEREVCQLLQAYDPEFEQLFRVVADLDDDLPRRPETQRALARALAAQMRSHTLLPPSAPALARLIDHGARRCGDATRISADLRHLLDVLQEADHLARAAQRPQVEAEDVAAAITARRERARRVDERIRDATLRDILAIATAGERVGQVNGLAVYQVGGEAFGLPARISATTRLGDGHVVDIQRETALGGPVHAKGVLILSSFLAARYSRFQPHAIVGSLVFEQTYGLVDGDSASLAELVALLSAIGDLPVRQGLAVTGAVDQFGSVQAIGGVNEKVEAFFDLCAARGLDGTQGVLIPSSNVSHLMLRDDVVDAVASGRFAVLAAGTVDDAVEVLTGLPAGDPAVARDDTVNGRIARRLNEYAALRRGEPRFLRHRPRRAAPAGAGKEST